jgi:hypothetical protein
MEPIKRAGVGIIRTIVLVIFVGAVGALGWFVWQAKHNTEKSLDNTTQSETVTPEKNTENTDKPVPTDITKDWTPYSSEKGKFSLRYPKTWVQPLNRDLCSPELFDRAVYLGPDAGSVLKCASEYFGQMSVSSVDGDKRAEYALGTGYKDITDKEVIINGVAGHRIAGVAKAATPDAGFAPAEGTIEVRYVFYAPAGVTYVAKYTQAPKGSSPSTDVLNDFDLMITKTLRFAS